MKSALPPEARILALANDRPGHEPSGDPVIGCANAFEVLQDNTLLIPYGDQPYDDGHTRCIQRLTSQAAANMVVAFNSFRGKATRRFGGLPFYVGHPDHPAFRKIHKDTKAYGWIMAMDTRPDGLALQMNWSEPGHELIANAHYKFFSPHWYAVEIGRENGRVVAEPVWLKSCGFTNDPNWPVFPMANQNANPTKEGTMEFLQRLLAILGMEAGGSEDDVVSTVTKLVEAAKKIQEQVEAKWDAEDAAREALPNEEPMADRVLRVLTLVGDGATALANEQTAKTELAAKVAELETERDQHKTAFDAEREARVLALVNDAVKAGRALPADKDKWIEDLKKDFDAKSEELANAKPALKTEPQTKDLGKRNSDAQNDNQSKILVLVNEKLTELGWARETRFHDAYMLVMKENPNLFGKEETRGDE